MGNISHSMATLWVSRGATERWSRRWCGTTIASPSRRDTTRRILPCTTTISGLPGDLRPFCELPKRSTIRTGSGSRASMLPFSEELWVCSLRHAGTLQKICATRIGVRSSLKRNLTCASIFDKLTFDAVGVPVGGVLTSCCLQELYDSIFRVGRQAKAWQLHQNGL